MSSLVHACYRASRVATLPLTLRLARGIDRRDVLSRADATVTLSLRARDIYARYGVDPQRLHVIPNFVLPDPSIEEDQGNGRFLFAGRLSPEKGVRWLLERWPEDVPLDIVGDGPERESLKMLRRGMVRIVGPLPHEQVLKMLGGYSGIVIPSLWPEGFPQIYVEALQAAVPTIATSCNSAGDDVVREGTGSIVEPQSGPTEMAAAIRSVLVRGRRLRRACRASYEARFTEEAWLRQVLALYGSLAR